jgi:hypothetical protein
MIVKKTKQLGNFKKGINLYVPKKRIVSPSGIPVASTASVIVASVASPWGSMNDTYSKKAALEEFIQMDGYSIRSYDGVCYRSSPNYSFVLVPPNVQMQWSDGDWQNLGSRNYWSLAWLRYDDGNINWSMGISSPEYNYKFRNDSTNASFIPQSSYYMYDSDLNITVFSSPLTITAA